MRGRSRLFGLAWVVGVGVLLLACAPSADPHTVEGALAKAADGLSRRDTATLFTVIDERARFAMASVVKSRREAAEVIRHGYPSGSQDEALRQLGDAAEVPGPKELFARRCDDTCLESLSRTVAAPTSSRVEGPVTVVETTRGAVLRMFKGRNGQWGIEWNTDALSRERDRAAAELELVKKNAELYAKQNALN